MCAFSKKGQQALEYLVTYGWAFVVVLIIIGAFTYFGILNPQKYLPDRCEFGEQLLCTDYSLDASFGNGVVRLIFTNGFGENILITNVTTAQGEGTFCTPPATSSCTSYAGNVIAIASGQTNSDASTHVILGLDATEYILVDSDKSRIPIAITFRRDEAGSPEHTLLGEVFATASE